MPHALIYCDGSGLATGGPAGVGYIAYVDGKWQEGSLPIPNATNQQAEILAAAFALTEIVPCAKVVVRSDSQYVVNGWGWLPGWIEKGWRTNNGPVANRKHWERLQAAVARHQDVGFKWVRGHDGNVHNERADALAVQARKGQQP